MKTFKIVCITVTIIIVALGLYNNSCNTKQENKSLDKVIIEQQTLIDSLSHTNSLLINYYCASENLLDSIFVHFTWQDVMDPYEYYDAIDNIYYQEFLYKYLESKRKQIYEQTTYPDQL